MKNYWFFDNIRSNLLNIIVGLDVSLLVNIFTGANKNWQLWFAIASYFISIICLLVTLNVRDKLEKDKEKFFQKSSIVDNIEKWEKFLQEKEEDFRVFKVWLLSFILILLFGIGLTYSGNQEIAFQEGKNTNDISQYISQSKSQLIDLNTKINSLKINQFENQPGDSSMTDVSPKIEKPQAQ